MNKQWNQRKVFLLTILVLSSCCLLFVIFSHNTWFIPYIDFLICATAIVMILHSFQQKKYFYILAYLSILVVYNPLIKLNLPSITLMLLHFGVLLFYLKNVFELIYLDKINDTARIAHRLNQYLREQERVLSHLTFHETATVIKREYPQEFQLNGTKISWRDREFPDFDFYVLAEYFSQGQKKGGLSARGKNDFSNIEIHLNFNLTHHVKYAVREDGGPFKTSLFGKQLKYTLIKKYQYVDMAKIIGI